MHTQPFLVSNELFKKIILKIEQVDHVLKQQQKVDAAALNQQGKLVEATWSKNAQKASMLHHDAHEQQQAKKQQQQQDSIFSSILKLNREEKNSNFDTPIDALKERLARVMSSPQSPNSSGENKSSAVQSQQFVYKSEVLAILSSTVDDDGTGKILDVKQYQTGASKVLLKQLKNNIENMSSNMDCIKYIAQSLKYIRNIQAQVLSETAAEYKANPPAEMLARVDYQVC